MRVVPFLICAVITTGLIVLLNTQLTISGNKTPRFGAFFSPQQGFWQNAESENASFDASLMFPDLSGRVEVYFDKRLVPHIYAEQENDAYFVQGYLHAKFRLWQMEFQTHAAGGRLSEIMGEKAGTTDFLRIDKFFRRIGMVYGAEQSLKELEANETTKKELDSYTAGINSYISTLRSEYYPLEYKLLNYAPEPWTNMKTCLFLKYMSFDLAGSDNDFEMTNALSHFSAADIEKLYPITQDSLNPIVPKGTLFELASIKVIKPSNADSLLYVSNPMADSSLVIKPNKNNGSNNWAVSGTKTKSGAPLLCNDPHLGLNLPSLWYEMQITTPTYSTYGVSFPGAPSVIIGFNDSIAWGVTNSGRDVKDYYEVHFRDSTMQEYKYNGVWKKAEFREEIIKVKGGTNITEKIAMTVWGPVMYDKQFGNPLKNGKYYALRWKAHDASNELWTFNKLNHARNYVDFLRAINTYQCPGQNFVYADKKNTIAIRQQGMFPAKWRRQGDFLMSGTDTTFQWQGFIPPRENPTLYNPQRGFVSSANQLAADETYPYYLSGPAEIYRGIIINRKLQQMSSITIQDMERMQNDNYNVFAEMAYAPMLKYLDQTKLSKDELKYLQQFKSWNFRNDINETGATIFNIWWDQLMESVFDDEFSVVTTPIMYPNESTMLGVLLKNDTTLRFVDDIKTKGVENISTILTNAFHKSMKEILFADSNKALPWGKFKDTGVRHLLKIPALSKLHLPIGGGSNIINAANGNHGPSWRMIVQMSDSIQAVGVYPGGQSGNPGSKYYDTFINSWVKGNYYKLQFTNLKDIIIGKNMKWKMTFSKS